MKNVQVSLTITAIDRCFVNSIWSTVVRARIINTFFVVSSSPINIYTEKMMIGMMTLAYLEKEKKEI